MIWDGTSRTRPDASVLRAPDNYDWARAVSEIQRLQNQEHFNFSSIDSVITGNVLRSGYRLAQPIYNDLIGVAISENQGKTAGIVSRNDWTPVAGTATLLAGVDYFLVNDGKISTSPPATGWVHKVGFALTPNDFVFTKQTSVRL